MFNIRTTQPSVSMQAITGTVAPEVSPEKIVWEKIQFFFPQENYEEAQQCLAEIFHPTRGTVLDHINCWFNHLKALTFPAWEDNIQCNREGIHQFCIVGADSKEVLVVGIDSQHCVLKWEGGTVTCSVDTQQVGDVGAMPLENREYEAMWTVWQHDVPPGNEEDRETALQRLSALKESGESRLDLHGLALTSLPPLPDWITELDVGGNSLSALPDNLPATLKNLTAGLNELTSLPDRLPAGLETLDVSYNELTIMPERLPDSLRELIFHKNQLTELPEELPQGLEILGVSKNKLTRLPETLPEKLRKLYVDENRITDLPETLPPELKELDVRQNRLTALPEILPDGLKRLDIAFNRLTHLPERLPSGLKKLNVSGNLLTTLPETLPSGLKKLNASVNQLTALAEALPSGLEELDASINQLTVLPETLPSGLKKLDASVNQLTALPETLPSGLEVLNVEYNQLTTFPECIVSELHATIRADGNHLSERAIQRLQELMSADDYEGSRVMFSMGRPSTTRTIQPLHQAVRNWLPLHEAEKWRAFETKTNAEVFSAFLDYLLKTQNAKNPDFMAEVSALLMRLGDDDALREKAFAITIEATERCEDRVTYTYHNIQCALQVYDIEKGDFDSRLSELIPLGREVFRLQQIEQIAQEKVKRMHLVDPIEVFLGYQNYLRDVFELKTVTKEMRFFRVSGITRADLQQAEERIKKAESASFRQWFARWDPWHKVLERIVPEVWNDIKERRADILESDEYKQRLREVVKSLKESGVQDVELSAQMGVFEDMDNRLLKSVTEKVLAEKGLEQLLNTPWKGKLEQ
ncbi:E3 ubiquitin--protein ligase [Salmonella bongori]|uniref:NEL-type E3 ubiquitin ligase domain-containing protein n=1 Tax=Salmonella bongori TaxID=54736 RepID=UPI0009AA0F71|nr:NEL-type E3 ubiquitin ligase domain-containing protein [Salmonella bongori]EGE4659716.1 E3 ubiquitin--protein ligase [Salmonella bongori serovar 48:i:- str. 94-0708]EIZ4349083.1 E3 ubiquitin--protein ligase [Salmonella bongori serovar 48:z81:-]ECG8258292.1 E3 ubiquitin--protein ligase [Salmonella bongori serovar 48:i:-]ECG9251780.1 E3 ubiquitin--protein ligase [Salmonella bongori]EDP8704910.1 E3 ubiquitin--protein ligase [Salmonella bongori]